MKYPSDWQKIKPDKMKIVFRSPEGDAVLFIGTESIDLPSWVEEENLQVGLAEDKRLMGEALSNNKTLGFKLIESNMITLDENIASKLVYVMKSSAWPGAVMKNTMLVSIKDDMEYTITFGADVNTYNHYAPIFLKMVDSIKLS